MFKRLLNHKQPLVQNSKGSIVVEFAVTLLFLFFFLIAFFQMTMIFLAHERVSYAAYTGARVNSVRGNVGSAVHLVRGKRFSNGADWVKVEERLRVPMDFRNIYKRRNNYFTVKQRFEIPREERDTGDNQSSGGPSGGMIWFGL